MLSKKLQRQLKRAFGTAEVEDLVAEANRVLKSGADFTEAERRRLDFFAHLPAFLDNIDRSYAENEDRLSIASRNIDISSAELSRAREAVTAMVDALTEGYLVVNADGVCDGVFSRVSKEIFERTPTGQHLFDLLKIPADEREVALGWLKLAFANRLGPNEVTELGPRQFVNAAGANFRLSYSLVRDGAKVTGLVVIAADITSELEAKRIADARVEEAKIITKLVEDRESFHSFASLAKEILTEVRGATELNDTAREQFRFDLHTLKGGASTFYLHDLEHVIHAAARVESSLNEVLERHGRVIGAGLPEHIGLTHASLKDLVVAGVRQDVSDGYLELLLSSTAATDVTQSLRSFESTVQVTASRLGKRVEFNLRGDGVRVSSSQYRRVFAALTHVFRNAVDHGIETPAERQRLGKPDLATIEVRFGGPTAEHFGWWLSIKDDGRGVNVDTLRERYFAVGETQVLNMADEDVLAMLLTRSVSTKTEITETSGMGVGLSAVGAAVRAVGGRWRVTSKLGQGTEIRLEFPMPEYLSALKRELNLDVLPRRAPESELNLRYNDLISEMAVMIREARERERVDQEIEMARAVQKTLLPAESMRYGEFHIAGRSYVAGSCGGDWWYHARSGEHVVVWIGDVLGHGIASALVASACRATAGVLHSVTPDAKIEEYLNVVNDVIYSMTAGEIYVTAVCMRVNLRTGETEFANASHPAGVQVGVGQGSRLINSPLAPPLGLNLRQNYESTRFRIEPGEGVFLMTDGLLDLTVTPGVRWSLPRLMKLLRDVEGGPRSDEMIGAVEAFVFNNAEGALADDTTYVAVHRALPAIKRKAA